MSEAQNERDLDVQEAAIVLESLGEHGRAASLRLEHAGSLRDQSLRTSVLREGCARNRGDTPEGQALHLELARSLVGHAQILAEGTARRAMQLEAAEAFEEAGHGTEAGELFESLGLLPSAARCYTADGDIHALESVLCLLETRTRASEAQVRLERDVASAVEEGRRRLALELLRDHLIDAGRMNSLPNPLLAHRLLQLEAQRITSRSLTLRIDGSAGTTRVRMHGASELSLGRAPDAVYRMFGAGVSRYHAVLRRNPADGRISAFDLGSKGGTFVDGTAIAPHEPGPLADRGELGLGLSVPIPYALSDGNAVFLRMHPISVLFAPLGGRALLEIDAPLPFEIGFSSEFALIRTDADTSLSLNGVPIGNGARFEALIGDRFQFEGSDSRFRQVTLEP